MLTIMQIYLYNPHVEFETSWHARLDPSLPKPPPNVVPIEAGRPHPIHFNQMGKSWPLPDCLTDLDQSFSSA
jgi:hypothetical protein